MAKCILSARLAPLFCLLVAMVLTQSRAQAAAPETPLAKRLTVVQRWLDNNVTLDESCGYDLRFEIEELPFLAHQDRKAARKLNASGLEQLARNKPHEAVALFRQAHGKDPADHEIANNLAYASLEAGRLEEALEQFRIALALAPGRTTAWANLGALYAKLDDLPRAVAAMRTAYRFSANPSRTLKFFTGQRDNDPDARIRQAAAAAVKLMHPSPTATPIVTVSNAGNIVPQAPKDPVATDAALGADEALNLFQQVREGDKQAMNSLHQHALDGNRLAQWMLGQAYYNEGWVGKSDWALAADWYRKSAVQDYAPAQFALAWSYSFGLGVTQSFVEAEKWYRRAAEHDMPEAQNNLGAIYARGLLGKANFAEASEWFLRAARHNNAHAIYNLALFYAEGYGVERDLPRAAELLLRAAKAGHAQAQLGIAQAYEYGKGVTVDRGEAINWYGKAALQGIDQAEDALKRLKVNTTEVLYQHNKNLSFPVVKKNGNYLLAVNNEGIFEFNGKELINLVSGAVDAAEQNLILYFGGCTAQHSLTLYPDNNKFIYRQRTPGDNTIFYLYDGAARQSVNLSEAVKPARIEDKEVGLDDLASLVWLDEDSVYGAEWFTGMYRLDLKNNTMSKVIDAWKIAKIIPVNKNELIYQQHCGTECEIMHHVSIHNGQPVEKFNVESMGSYSYSQDLSHVISLYFIFQNGFELYETKNCLKKIMQEFLPANDDTVRVPQSPGVFARDNSLIVIPYGKFESSGAKKSFAIRIIELHTLKSKWLEGYEIRKINSPFSTESTQLILFKEKTIFLYNFKSMKLTEIVSFKNDYHDHCWASDGSLYIAIDNKLIHFNKNNITTVDTLPSGFFCQYLQISSTGTLVAPLLKTDEIKSENNFIYDVKFLVDSKKSFSVTEMLNSTARNTSK